MQTVVSVEKVATLKAIHLLQIHKGVGAVWVSPCQEANTAFLGTSLLPWSVRVSALLFVSEKMPQHMAAPRIQRPFRVQKLFHFSWCSLKGHGLLQCVARLSNSLFSCLSPCPPAVGDLLVTYVQLQQRSLACTFPILLQSLDSSDLGDIHIFPESFSTYQSAQKLLFFFSCFAFVISVV